MTFRRSLTFFVSKTICMVLNDFSFLCHAVLEPASQNGFRPGLLVFSRTKSLIANQAVIHELLISILSVIIRVKLWTIICHFIFLAQTKCPNKIYFSEAGYEETARNFKNEFHFGSEK